jgi:hypothetical protein
MANCKSYNELFEFRQFLQILESQLSDNSFAISLDDVTYSLQACGVAVDEIEATYLVKILFGSLDAGLPVLYELVCAVRNGLGGIEYLLSHYQQWKRAVAEFFLLIDSGDLGPGVTFNQSRFVEACKMLNNSFNLADFLHHLVENTLDNDLDESIILHTFLESGIPSPISRVDYTHLVTSLCTDSEHHISLFSEWVKVLVRCDVDTFIRICN